MGYKIGDDNGRVEGSFDELTAENIAGKFEYGKRDRSANDKIGEYLRDFDTYKMEENDSDNITKEIISEGEL